MNGQDSKLINWGTQCRGLGLGRVVIDTAEPM